MGDAAGGIAGGAGGVGDHLSAPIDYEALFQQVMGIGFFLSLLVLTVLMIRYRCKGRIPWRCAKVATIVGLSCLFFGFAWDCLLASGSMDKVAAIGEADPFMTHFESCAARTNLAVFVCIGLLHLVIARIFIPAHANAGGSGPAKPTD